MRAAHRDLRTFQSLGHRGDIDADARAVGVVLARHLLLGRKNRLDGPEVDVDHPRIGTLLDDSRDDVTLATFELAENLVVPNVAQSLIDDLLGRKGGDPSEVAGAID